MDHMNMKWPMRRISTFARAAAKSVMAAMYDFTQLLDCPALLKEFKGKLGHFLYDDTTGWHTNGTFEADGGFVGDVTGKADEAAHADSADSATSAGHATTADSATSAGHATTADSATSAASAATADEADALSGGLVRGTVEYRQAVLKAGADAVASTTGPEVTVAAEKTDAKVIALVTEPTGRTLKAWDVLGGYTEAAGVSGSAQLYKRDATSGMAVDTALGSSVSLVKNTGVLSASHTLASPEVIADDVSYFVLVLLTTGAGDAATIFTVMTGAQ